MKRKDKMGIFNFLKKAFTFEEEQEKLTQIATKSWINVHYRILFNPKENNILQRKAVEEYVTKIYNDLIKIVINIKQVVANDKIIGYTNEFIGKNAVLTYEKLPKILHTLSFKRNFTFKVNELKEDDDSWEFLVKSKEKEDKEENKEISFKSIKKGEKVIYGYSPIDFLQDKSMLFELDKEICDYLKINPSERKSISLFYFNKEGEPMIRYLIGTMILEHKVSDRIELMNNHPKIEKSCFMNSFDNYFEEIKKQEKNKNLDKWIKAVEKLLKENERIGP